MNWSTIVVAIVSGISTGFLTALVTPWAQWAVDVRRDQRESRRKFIKEWQSFASYAREGQLFMRDMTTSANYPMLVKHLSPLAREELRRLISEYDKQWEQFKNNKLPELNNRFNSKEVDAHRFFEDSINAEKRKLGKPLHSFLLEQLAELNERWRLL